MTSQRRIDKLNSELGYKKIDIKVSKDYTKLKINNDVYPLNSVKHANVGIVHHASADVLVSEEENYNLHKGYVIAEWMDDPIGYLGGIETKQEYETKIIKRVELVVHFNDESKKRYVAGIFISTDYNLNECIEETKLNCRKIISSIKKVNLEVDDIADKEVVEEKSESFILWFLKTTLMITMIVFFFPFSLIYLWFKYKKK